MIRCLYQRGIPQKDFDYSYRNHDDSSASESNNNDIITAKQAQQKLTICLPPSVTAGLSPPKKTQKNVTKPAGGSGSPEGRSSGSAMSADFFSCLDEEEHYLNRKFSSDVISTTAVVTASTVATVAGSRLAREPIFSDDMTSPILVDGDFSEPFLDNSREQMRGQMRGEGQGQGE